MGSHAIHKPNGQEGIQKGATAQAIKRKGHRGPLYGILYAEDLQDRQAIT